MAMTGNAPLPAESVLSAGMVGKALLRDAAWFHCQNFEIIIQLRGLTLNPGRENSLNLASDLCLALSPT